MLRIQRRRAFDDPAFEPAMALYAVLSRVMRKNNSVTYELG